jgi:predicted porin
MIKVLGFLLIALTSYKAQADGEILLSPYYGFGRANMYGQDQVPTYEGALLGLELEYKFYAGHIALGFFGSYAQGEFDNTNNNVDQKEVLETKYMVGGIKAHFGRVYFKAGYGLNKTNDISTGTVKKKLNLDESALLLGLGINFRPHTHVQIFLGLDSYYSKHDPSFNGVSQSTSQMNYNAIIGLSLTLPSTATAAPGNKN